MLSFDYTVDLQLSETLADVDRLRTHILSLPMSPKTETRLEWEALAIRTWATLALAGHDLPKHHVATILAHTIKPTRSTATIYGLRAATEYIHTSWRANPKPVSLPGLSTLHTLLYPHPDAPFQSLEQPLSALTSYLSAENAHPVIQASIAHMYILTLPALSDSGLFARMTHYLLLAKFGYDLRGYATPERAWQEDARTYGRLRDIYLETHHMNLWFSFMAERMRNCLETLYGDIGESRFHIEFPKSFWELSDRQKQIMRLLETPDTRVTNREIKRRYKISNITASRDLTRLASLGLIYPHGKGRSVYYTKI
jgi:hypothetical protein